MGFTRPRPSPDIGIAARVARRLAVEAGGHQRRLIDKPEPMLESLGGQFVAPSRHQKLERVQISRQPRYSGCSRSRGAGIALYSVSSSSSAFAALRSWVSNPSLNQL